MGRIIFHFFFLSFFLNFRHPRSDGLFMVILKARIIVYIEAVECGSN